MSKRFKTPRHQGDWGLLQAMQYFVSEGYECFVPWTEATRIDLMIAKGQDIKRVQVKSSGYSETNGKSFAVALSTAGARGSWQGIHKTISSEEVDLVFIWCFYEDSESCWLFDAKEVEDKRVLTVGPKNAEHMVSGEVKGKTQKELAEKPPTGRKNRKTCATCDEKIDIRSTHCRKCAAMDRRPTKGTWMNDDELVRLTKELGFSAVGRMVGVTPSAVHKRLRVRGLL